MVESDRSTDCISPSRRDVENNVLTELSGENIDSATPIWQHENALIRIPAQILRWMYLSLLMRPARKTHRFFRKGYRRLKRPGSWKRLTMKFLKNTWRTIEGLVLFRLCIPGGWPSATWTQRVLWYGGFCCMCLLASFSIWVVKTGSAFSDPLTWYSREVMTEGGGHSEVGAR